MNATTVTQMIILVIFIVEIIGLARVIRKKGFKWNAIAISLLVWLINASAWLAVLLVWKPELTDAQISIINLWSWIVRGHAAIAIGAGLYYLCYRSPDKKGEPHGRK